jgi:cyclohexanone monooxygenase
MNIRGSNGKTLQEFWNPEPVTFMGITVPGYPNFFMLSGPQSTFANIPVVIDRCVKFISATISKARSVGADVIEPTREAADAYNAHCKMLLDFNAIIKSGAPQHSWFLGANVEGKSQSAVYFYYGGAAGYFAELRGVIDKDFDGLSFTKHAEKALA